MNLVRENSEEGNFILLLNEGGNIVNLFMLDGSLVLEQQFDEKQEQVVFQLDHGTYILRVFDMLTHKVHLEKITIN